MAIGREILFEFDNFQKPKLLSVKDTVANTIINLMLMRPGNLPSLPHVGIDIRQYLYVHQGDLDQERLKQKIYEQCNELLSYVTFGDIKIFITRYNNEDLLLVSIPIIGVGGADTNLLLGVGQSDGDVNIAYKFEDMPL